MSSNSSQSTPRFVKHASYHESQQSQGKYENQKSHESHKNENRGNKNRENRQKTDKRAQAQAHNESVVNSQLKQEIQPGQKSKSDKTRLSLLQSSEDESTVKQSVSPFTEIQSVKSLDKFSRSFSIRFNRQSTSHISLESSKSRSNTIDEPKSTPIDEINVSSSNDNPIQEPKPNTTNSM